MSLICEGYIDLLSL